MTGAYVQSFLPAVDRRRLQNPSNRAEAEGPSLPKVLKCPSFFFPVSPPPPLIIQRHGSEMVVGGRQGGRPPPPHSPLFGRLPPPFSETDTRSLVLLRLRRRSSLCLRPLGRCTRAITRQEGKEKQVADKKRGRKMRGGRGPFSSQKAHHGRHRVDIRFFPPSPGLFFKSPLSPRSVGRSLFCLAARPFREREDHYSM